MCAKKVKNKEIFCHPEMANPINTLLANIRFASIEKPLKTIVITSVSVDEGKTTTSTNLAAAIAKSGKSCIIVDADMRKNGVRRMLGFQPKYGFYSLLGGRCKVNEAICKTQINNLYFLDCEHDVPNPSDILASSRFNLLVKYLKSKFDYVIFDTPPLISFVDAAVIGSIVDATILVVREGKTKKVLVPKALEQLKQAKANVLGSVLTFSSDSKASEYYYTYYNKSGKRVGKRSSGEPPITQRKKYVDINENLSTWLKPYQIDTPKGIKNPNNNQQQQPQTDQNQQSPYYNPGSTHNNINNDKLRAMQGNNQPLNNSAANQSINDVFRTSQTLNIDDPTNNNNQNSFL